METTKASFDLNHAIQEWRARLGESPAFRRENLEELETHLRDSIANLAQRGLAEDEAFIIATRRVGGEAVLGKEFAKINSRDLWLNRALWMLVGIQLVGFLRVLGSGPTFFITAFVVKPVMLSGNDPSTSWFAVFLVALVQLLTTAVLFTIGWRMLTRKGNSAYVWVRKNSWRMAAAISSWLLLMLLPHMINTTELAWYSKFAPRYPTAFVNTLISGTNYAWQVQSIAFVILTLLLARQQLLTKTRA